MDNMQRRLEEARAQLLYWQRYLASSRRNRYAPDIKICEHNFLRALDRAWEVQCMAQGSL